MFFMLHFIVVMSEMLSVVVGFYNYVACVSLLSAGQLASIVPRSTWFCIKHASARVCASLRGGVFCRTRGTRVDSGY